MLMASPCVYRGRSELQQTRRKWKSAIFHGPFSSRQSLTKMEQILLDWYFQHGRQCFCEHNNV